MNESNTLDTLLEKSSNYYPLYGGGLATHLPMVLVALNGLSASKNKLNRTFEEGVHDLEYIGDLENITAVKSVECELGRTQSFKRYLKYYQNELKSYGVDRVLKKSLPLLMSGIAASAFHALIRLAYALEAQCQSEIAIALAYWSSEYQPFELNVESTDETLEQILTRLAPVGRDYQFSPGIIVNRMSEIAQLLKQEALIVQPKLLDLPTLRNFALKVFYFKDDFTLLHTVTGCHAFSIIMPYLKGVDIALQELWKAMLVAYLSTGLSFQDKDIRITNNDIDFSFVINKALDSDDSHVIKLVYTCYREYTVCNDPLYFVIAERAVLDSCSD
ncbi:questin oxidase family protein [Pseudoalteromonas sp. MMG012]|uniref:questin oxidase family protein n=1 Tax=Pseudoalteromonas sp. MMG012 TaxID=2822686 RepID=UPI001B3A1CF3|nr:questin oxidase family protein [Pseudoalteromonas sp. MMG012]MBQ4852408.1 questin oxidase family protein [Pseudoalteromonas sp. MMG012]